MKTVPRFMHGPYRIAMRVVLEEMNTTDEVQVERGWKFVPPLAQIVAVSGTTGWIDPEIQVEFNRGVWRELLEASRKCCLKQPCRGVEKTDLSSCDIPFHESWCDEFQFARNSRSAKRSAAGSPSGMTV